MTCLDLDICEICIPLCYPVLTPYTDSIFRSTKKKKKIIYSWYKRNYGTIIQMYLHMLLEYEYGSAEKCRVYKVALKALWFDLKYHQGNF